MSQHQGCPQTADRQTQPCADSLLPGDKCVQPQFSKPAVDIQPDADGLEGQQGVAHPQSRLGAEGLGRRSVNGEDARRRLITLTEKGAEQQALFEQSFLDTEEAMVRGFSQEEREALLSLLNRVIQNLKEDSEA